MVITPEQCKAARALLHWTPPQSAGRAGLSATAIAHFESGERPLPLFAA
jgi:transcriptional regulator with XRE-family HTH domain